MNNIVNNQAMELIKDGTKGLPGWANVLIGLGLAAIPIFCSYMEINHKAKKQQETNKKKSELRKEELSHNSALRTQELKEKTAQAIDLDNHKTDNRIRIIQAKGQEEREKIALKHNLSQKVSSMAEDVSVEPTFPTTAIEVDTSDGEFWAGPLYKKSCLNNLDGAPGAGKSSILDNSLFYISGTLQRCLFSNEKPGKYATCYLYDYELGKAFYKRYKNLQFRNFYRCDMQEKAIQIGDVVFSLDYLFKLIQEDLEYASGDVIMAIDCIGLISDVKDRANEFIIRLKRFISDYEANKIGTLTFILVGHLNPNSASPSSILCESKMKGSQSFNDYGDQTILLGKTRINGCVRVKITKNRYGVPQESTIHLFEKVDNIFFNYIGEYDERQVLVPKDGTIISLDEFRKKVKPTLMPTYKMLKTNSKPGRPTQLTKPICMAILDKRSQGMSKNEASVSEGFARQAYNDALVRYGLVDDYPLGNWKP